MEGELTQAQATAVLRGDATRAHVQDFLAFILDVYPDLTIDLLNSDDISQHQQYNTHNVPNVFLPTNGAWRFVLGALGTTEDALKRKLKTDVFGARRVFRKVLSSHVVVSFSRRGESMGFTSGNWGDLEISWNDKTVRSGSGDAVPYEQEFRVGANKYAGIDGLLLPSYWTAEDLMNKL